MPDWKKLIAGKIAIAQKGSAAGKINNNVRVPAGQKQVNNFPVLDMGLSHALAKPTGGYACLGWCKTSWI